VEAELSLARVVVELEKLLECLRTILVEGVMVKAKLHVQGVEAQVKYSIRV
jgi:hypothetical protein